MLHPPLRQFPSRHGLAVRCEECALGRSAGRPFVHTSFGSGDEHRPPEPMLPELQARAPTLVSATTRTYAVYVARWRCAADAHHSSELLSLFRVYLVVQGEGVKTLTSWGYLQRPAKSLVHRDFPYLRVKTRNRAGRENAQKVKSMAGAYYV